MGYVGYQPAAVGYSGSRGDLGYTGSAGIGAQGYTGSGAGGSYTETIVTPASTLTGLTITGTAGQCSITSSATNTLVNDQLITISGTEEGTQLLDSVFISGTGGQFGCTTTQAPIVTGQQLTISGVKTGSGSITGYTNPKTYYVITTDGSTSFQLSETSGGSAITTTTGVPGGLTYTLSVGAEALASVTVTGTGGQFLCTATTKAIDVNQIIRVDGTLTGDATITGLTDPKTYYVIATNGSTTFTLSESLGGSAIATTVGATGSTTGLSFYARATGAFGGYDGTTKTYYILTTNGSSTFTLTDSIGGSAISTSIGTPLGLTYTTSQIALSTIATTSSTGQFSCDAASKTLTVGQRVRLYGTNSGTGTITGYSDPKLYYIIATNGSTTFQLSLTKSGAAITTTSGSLTGMAAIVDVGQSVYTIAYTVGKIALYLNGVKLVSGTDFTASNGTSVTLSGGILATENLCFVTF